MKCNECAKKSVCMYVEEATKLVKTASKLTTTKCLNVEVTCDEFLKDEFTKKEVQLDFIK